jgi:predicted PurR-regulated permease PerM
MMENEKQASFIRKRFFFYLLFLLLILLALVMLRPYFTTIIISLISVILLKPVYDFFFGLRFVKERHAIAVTLTLLSALLVIVIPLYFFVRLTVTQMTEAFSDFGSLEVEAIIDSVQELFGDTSTAAVIGEGTVGVIEPVFSFVASAGLGVAQWILEQAQSIPFLLTQAIIFIAIVASLLPYFDDLIELSQKASPIGRNLAQLYNRKIIAMVRSLFTGVFLIAIIQGLAMGFFYWLAGMDRVFLLIVISSMLAIIPMVGISWLVIAIAIVSFINGNTTQAIIVLFGFYGVVNWIDVFLRPKFISKEAHLQTALFLLSMFAGLAWAGFMGIFYGPIIMLMLVTTIEIYIEEFAKEDGERLGIAISSGTAPENSSQADDISVNDAGEVAIAEEG